MKKKMTISDIFKRYQSLNETFDDSSLSRKDCLRLYEQSKRSNDRKDVVRFVKECGSTAGNAVAYLRPCIMYLEQYSNDKEIENIFIEEVLTKITDDDLNDIYGAQIPENVKESVEWQMKKNRASDRIIHNHNFIMNKCNIDNFFKENHTSSSEFFIHKICTIVESMKGPLYSKVNGAIEEAFYMYGKNDIPFDEQFAVDTVLNYFLIKEECEDLSELDAVVQSNICVDYEEKTNNATLILDKFRTSQNKNDITLSTTVTSFFQESYYTITKYFPALLELFRELCIANSPLCQSSLYTNVIPGIMTNLEKFSNENFYHDLLAKIGQYVDDEINKSGLYTNRFGDEIVTSNMITYQSALEDLREKISEALSFAYTGYNIRAIGQNSITEAQDIITLNEFKVFKFNNLLNTCRKIDKYLQMKMHGLFKKSSNKVKHLKSKIFEEASEFDMINSEYFVDCCVGSYVVEDVNDPENHKIFTELCKELNESNILQGTRCRAYYMINPDTVDIHIRENIMVPLDDEQDLYESRFTPLDMDRVLEVTRIGEIVEGLDESMDVEKVAKEVFSNNPDGDMFKLFMDAASVIGVEPIMITNIADEVNMANPAHESSFFYSTNHYISNYKPEENAPLDVKLEAYAIMQGILEDVKEDDKNNKTANTERKILPNKEIEKKNNEKDEKENKGPSKADAAMEKAVQGINNIKLYLQGLKKKAKDLNSKEQEVCRNADASFNMLARNVKNALVSDRREAIIKGSVIPSFSKSCKIAVGLAAIGTIATPGAAIIAALGGLAASKNLTKKERALLLDEIDVELEMLEKEIQLAESKNQMKKLRKLMLMRKDLQRQYQRIKLNIRVGKDLIPGSNAGRKQYGN